MAAHPWTGLYPKRIPMTMPVSHGSLIQEWTERVERAPDAPAVAYFDGLLGVRQVDDDSEASGSPRRAWHRTRRSGRGVPAEHPSIRPRLARAVEAWRHCARAEPYVPRGRAAPADRRLRRHGDHLCGRGRGRDPDHSRWQHRTVDCEHLGSRRPAMSDATRCARQATATAPSKDTDELHHLSKGMP